MLHHERKPQDGVRGDGGLCLHRVGLLAEPRRHHLRGCAGLEHRGWQHHPHGRALGGHETPLSARPPNLGHVVATGTLGADEALLTTTIELTEDPHFAQLVQALTLAGEPMGASDLHARGRPTAYPAPPPPPAPSGGSSAAWLHAGGVEDEAVSRPLLDPLYGPCIRTSPCRRLLSFRRQLRLERGDGHPSWSRQRTRTPARRALSFQEHLLLERDGGYPWLRTDLVYGQAGWRGGRLPGGPPWRRKRPLRHSSTY
jgi:hypothetical protein